MAEEQTFSQNSANPQIKIFKTAPTAENLPYTEPFCTSHAEGDMTEDSLTTDFTHPDSTGPPSVQHYPAYGLSFFEYSATSLNLTSQPDATTLACLNPVYGQPTYSNSPTITPMDYQYPPQGSLKYSSPQSIQHAALRGLGSNFSGENTHINTIPHLDLQDGDTQLQTGTGGRAIILPNTVVSRFDANGYELPPSTLPTSPTKLRSNSVVTSESFKSLVYNSSTQGSVKNKGRRNNINEKTSKSHTNKSHTSGKDDSTSGVKRYECSIPSCGKSFSLEKDMKRHSKDKHFNRKKIRCPFCVKHQNTARIDNIKRHLNQVHQLIPQHERDEFLNQLLAEK